MLVAAIDRFKFLSRLVQRMIEFVLIDDHFKFRLKAFFELLDMSGLLPHLPHLTFIFILPLAGLTRHSIKLTDVSTSGDASSFRIIARKVLVIQLIFS